MAAAYDAFLKGWSHFLDSTPDGYAKAIPYFEEAIRLDPNYGRPYAALALVYSPPSWVWATWEQKLNLSTHQLSEKGYAYLNEARKRPTSLSYQASGVFQFQEGAFMAAYDDFQQAIVLDPSDPWSYADMANVLIFDGRPKEAIQFIRTAMRIDPSYPPQYAYILGLAEFGMANFEAAANSFEDATKRNSSFDEAFLLLAATYGQMGRKQEAAAAIAGYNSLIARQGRPSATVASATFYRDHFIEASDWDRLSQGLQLAGMPAY